MVNEEKEMEMPIIKYSTEEEWRALRHKTIGSSEVAALLDIEGAFTTRFQLWAEKTERMPPSFEETERMRWGKRLERVIAEGICEQEGWDLIVPEGYYLHDKIEGMGASPDFLIFCPKRGKKGVLEIKLIDYASYMREWLDDEPPLKYLIQLQEQLSCTGYEWGAIAPMINGNTLKKYEYDRHEASIKAIEEAVQQFWQDIRDGKEPKVVAEDYEVVREFYAAEPLEVIDLSGDNMISELCANALAEAEKRLSAEKKEKAAKAEIIQKMGSASIARCNGFSVSRKTVLKNMQAKEAHVQKSERLNIKEINE